MKKGKFIGVDAHGFYQTIILWTAPDGFKEMLRMNLSIIDAHIHFDQYPVEEQKAILGQLNTFHVESLISVSMDLDSCKNNLRLSQQDLRIKPAFGFHPEQFLPREEELEHLFHFLWEQQHAMVALGEVGLPFYTRKENPSLQLEPYIEVLEEFIKLASKLHKPIVLHAIYEDAITVCDLLEKHSVEKAHFHWFKGDALTLERMMANQFFISFTPDILAKEKIRKIASLYPTHLIMAETDGPWSFEDIFPGENTHPKMVHSVVEALATIKKLPIKETYEVILKNTKQFYNLHD